MKNLPFLARRLGDKLLIQERVRYRAKLLSFKEGQLFQVVIKPFRENVSDLETKVRGYYFGHVLPHIVSYTGHSEDKIHEAMKQKYVSYTDEHGLQLTRSIFSNKSTLDLDEKWEFVEKVRAFAHDYLDIVTHDPDPEWKKQQP